MHLSASFQKKPKKTFTISKIGILHIIAYDICCYLQSFVAIALKTKTL